MKLVSEELVLAGTPSYAARPANARGALPAVVVIQEVWGVDDHIEDLADRFATAGYLAVAPDLYAQDGTRPAALAAERINALKAFLDEAPPAVWRDTAARDAALAELEPERRDALSETMALVLRPDRPVNAWTRTLLGVARALRKDERCTGRVASTGYCLGGNLSARLAGADPGLCAAAIYYGPSPDPEIMKDLACPLIGFYGEQDERITSGVPAFEQALRAAGHDVEVHIYPDTGHAFFNDTRPSYRLDAARDAWARTLALFARCCA